MKVKIIAIAATLAISPVLADTYVPGYFKKDGTYVEGHYKRSPNSTRTDNYSSKGNTNPYTGERGSTDPYAPKKSTTYDSYRSYEYKPYTYEPPATYKPKKYY